MSIKVGDIVLKHGVALAPMAGVTDVSFRKICYAHGAEYFVSEMLSAKALCYEQIGKRKESAVSGTAPLAAITAEEGPTAVQIFGCDPQFMAEAARMLQTRSYRGCISEKSPVAIDINMGCPMRKIVGNGEGSALMRDIHLAGQVVEAVASAVSIPVTVKIRAGWDSDSVNAPEMARVLEASGAAVICVHARTREQMYTPGISLKVIEDVKKSVSVPVFGNGDIFSAKDALEMIDKTGCDGVMIGRGATGNPWIFEEIRAALDGREYSYPDCEKRLSVAYEHMQTLIQRKGERTGLAEGKKHAAWYLSGLRGSATARNEIMNAATSDEIFKIFERIKAENI